MKVKLTIALVWSIALYRCESLSLKNSEERLIESFELWLWRRVLRISWQDMKTKEWVRKAVDVPEEESSLEMVKRRKLRKYDHWKRRVDSLVLATIEGEACARGRRGRRRCEWINNIRNWIEGMNNAREMAIMRIAHSPDSQDRGKLN